MEYFDKKLLDNRSTEWIVEQLDFYQGIVNNPEYIEECRTYNSKVMEELLNYYFDRYEADYNAKEMEARKGVKLVAGEEIALEDIPF